MRLPEHQARIIQTNQELNNKRRPTLDPHKWEEINVILGEAYREGIEVRIRIFDPYEDKTVTGIIVKVDILTRKLLVAGVWVPRRDIVEVFTAQ